MYMKGGGLSWFTRLLIKLGQWREGDVCFPSKESIKEPKKIDTGAALLDASAAPPQLLDGDNVTTVKIPGLWPFPTPKEQRHTHARVCVQCITERERAVPSSSRDPFMCVQKDPSHVIHYSIRRREKETVLWAPSEGYIQKKQTDK